VFVEESLKLQALRETLSMNAPRMRPAAGVGIQGSGPHRRLGQSGAVTSRVWRPVPTLCCVALAAAVAWAGSAVAEETLDVPRFEQHEPRGEPHEPREQGEQRGRLGSMLGVVIERVPASQPSQATDRRQERRYAIRMRLGRRSESPGRPAPSMREATGLVPARAAWLHEARAAWLHDDRDDQLDAVRRVVQRESQALRAGWSSVAFERLEGGGVIAVPEVAFAGTGSGARGLEGLDTPGEAGLEALGETRRDTTTEGCPFAKLVGAAREPMLSIAMASSSGEATAASTAPPATDPPPASCAGVPALAGAAG